MSDQRTIAAAQTAAAAKVSEAMEAAIRALLKERKNERDKENQNQNEGQQDKPYEPNNADVSQYQNYYEAYRSMGVDEPTASAAAADAALGDGADDSDNIRRAHEQIENATQRAKDYRAANSAAIDGSNSTEVRQEALNDAQKIATGLGIRGQNPEEIVEAIKRLDPPLLPQTDMQTGVTSESVGKEALQQRHQEAYEQQGARPATAQAASYEAVGKKVGAADGPAIQQAHQEIRQHNILKDMYRGVYEKSGVSPEVAEQAADQMARGNGANRAAVVQQAHDQALANAEKSQNISPEAAQTSTSQERNVNRSPEVRTPARPKPVQSSQQASSSQVPRPIPKTDRAQASEAKPAPNTEAPAQTSEAQTSDSLWEQHSPTEQGAKLRSQADYDRDSRLNDAHFAYNALSSGAAVEDVKSEILSNSAEANSIEQPGVYADLIIARAEKEITSSQQTAEPIPAASPVDQLSQPPSPAEKERKSGIVAESYGVQQHMEYGPDNAWASWSIADRDNNRLAGGMNENVKRAEIDAGWAFSEHADRAKQRSQEKAQSPTTGQSTAQLNNSSEKVVSEQPVNQAKNDYSADQEFTQVEPDSAKVASIEPPNGAASADESEPTDPDTAPSSQSRPAQPAVEMSAQASPPNLTAREIYSKFDAKKKNGVFAAATRSNPRIKDAGIAQAALAAGHTPNEVKAAIAENSLYAQKLKGAESYSKRTVNGVQQTADFEQKAPEMIWAKYQSNPGQETLSDKAVAREALVAGYDPKHVEQAISKNSPTAQQNQDPDIYSKTIVDGTAKELAKGSKGAKSQKETDKEQSKDQKPSAGKKPSQQKPQSKQKSKSKQKAQTKAKSKDRGMSI